MDSEVRNRLQQREIFPCGVSDQNEFCNKAVIRILDNNGIRKHPRLVLILKPVIKIEE
jgi:hypothetical protein